MPLCSGGVMIVLGGFTATGPLEVTGNLPLGMMTMIDGLWIAMLVAALIGVWVIVGLLGLLSRTASELLFFLKHKELMDRHRRREPGGLASLYDEREERR